MSDKDSLDGIEIPKDCLGYLTTFTVVKGTKFCPKVLVMLLEVRLPSGELVDQFTFPIMGDFSFRGMRKFFDENEYDDLIKMYESNQYKFLEGMDIEQPFRSDPSWDEFTKGKRLDDPNFK